MVVEFHDDLYNLLPIIYRIRDRDLDCPLRSLLSIITKQVDIIKEDIDGLWDNFFIETCDDWVIPYIGDLVGNIPLQYTGRSNRPDVAKTIYYRRRKGTLPVLEELAHDVTDWGCHVVEFFQLLDWTQNMNHTDIETKGCANVRDLTVMDLVDTPFDSTVHSVDVRSIGQTNGYYNIRNIGFYLWRLNVLPLRQIEPFRVQAGDSANHSRYHFDTLGQPQPLFNKPTFRSGVRTSEEDLPGLIRRLEFNKDFYYGKNHGVNVYVDDKLVDTNDVVFQDLCSWQDVQTGTLTIDPRLGRFAFADDGMLTVIERTGEGEEIQSINLATLEGRKIRVDYNTAFSGFFGAGTYDRSDTLKREGEVLISGHESALFIRVSKDIVDENYEASIQDALDRWKDPQQPLPDAIIQIEDSGTYLEKMTIELPDQKSKLVIQAANNQRPTVIIEGEDDFSISGASEEAVGGVILNGLLITAHPTVNIGVGVANLEIYHCTIDPRDRLDEDGDIIRPKLPSIFASRTSNLNPNLIVSLVHSIVGGINLPGKINELIIRDCIIDGQASIAIASEENGNIREGPTTRIERSTILGACNLKELILASEVLFTEKVNVQRKQRGCVRFSYVPRDSEMPRQYKCIYEDPPGDDLENFAEKPTFRSLNFGDPWFCQLSLNSQEKICTSGERGSELGVFCSLNNPIRIQNLKMKLEEYLPFGLKPGIIFMT